MKKIEYIALFFVAGFLLMIAALYNGFPIVDEGSTAFIEQAAYPHFTPDSTPFYGLFIKVSSLGWSLWFPVIVQALVMGFLLLRFMAVVFRSRVQGPVSIRLVLLALLLVAAFSCASLPVSQLMADSFTGILLLSVLLIFCDEEASRSRVIAYGAVAFMAVTMHFSHIVIAGLCAIAIAVPAYRRRQKILLRGCTVVGAVCVSFWLMMCTSNALKHHGFVFARGTDVFLTGRFAESGILKQYLSEQCGKKQLKMCAMVESLPMSQRAFLGSGESPLYKMGGWDSGASEYRTVLADVFMRPAFMATYVRKSVINSAKQFVYVVPPAIFPPFDKKSEPYKKVQRYYTDESREYITSQQQQGLFAMNDFRVVYLLVLLLSCVWVGMLPGIRSDKSLRLIYTVLFLLLVANALSVGFLGSVSPRLQYRIAWLLPATNIFVLLAYYSNSVIHVSVKKRSI